MSDFGNSEDNKLNADYNMFSPDVEKSEYLYAPYGTKNSKSFKEAGGIILSPSGISKFFNNSKEWYEDRTGIPVFDGNTNTVLGNAVHAYIHSFYDTQQDYDGRMITIMDVEKWIDDKYGMNPKVDKAEVLKNYQSMIAVWTKAFVSKTVPSHVEVEMEVIEHDDDKAKIGVFGSADAVFGKTLVDWKTCGNKPSGIGNYKHQLMQYARALGKSGIEIDTIKIVYIQKPTKTIVARIWEFEHEITMQDRLQADWYTELQVNCILLVRNNPGITDLVFRENPVAAW